MAIHSYTMQHHWVNWTFLCIYVIEDVGCNPATGGWRSCTTLHTAAKEKQFPIVQYLVKQCQLDPTALDNSNRSPLVYACYSGDLGITSYLIKSMCEYMKLEDILYDEKPSITTADAVVSRNLYTLGIVVSDFHEAPLSCACYHGHLAIVEYLIKKCDCDPLRPEGSKQRIPIESAVLGGQLHIVKYLANTKQIQASSNYRTELSLVYYAAIKSHLEMVKYLTQTLHCDPNCKIGHNTPLHVAAYRGDLCIVKFLLRSLRCDARVEGCDSMQPIHLAAESGQLEVVKYLIEEQSCDPLAIDKLGCIWQLVMDT